MKVASFVMLIALDPCVCFLLFDHLLCGCFFLSLSSSFSPSLSLFSPPLNGWCKFSFLFASSLSIHSVGALFSAFTLYTSLCSLERLERTEAGKEPNWRREGKNVWVRRGRKDLQLIYNLIQRMIQSLVKRKVMWVREQMTESVTCNEWTEVNEE